RINLDDRTTAYWYPCQTSAGAIRADRLVLPIPPGTHWSDAKPVILPETEKTLPGKAGDGPCKRLPRATASPAVSRGRSSAGIRPAITGLSGLRFDFGAVGDGKANGAGGPREPAKSRRTGNASAERSRTNDPRRVAAARE